MKIAGATNTLTTLQRKAVYDLWNNEYPAQLSFTDLAALDSYLVNLKKQAHYFAIDDSNFIVGWAISFDRDNERWFAIIVNSKIQRGGIGTHLLHCLKEHEAVLNGWATDHNNYLLPNGMPYPSPVAFYVKNGFVVCGETRLELDVLSAVKIKWDRDRSPSNLPGDIEVE